MLKVLAAIEFMHNENLVHRNLYVIVVFLIYYIFRKAENILIFDENHNKVKVTDFGLTRKVDTTVKYLEYVNNYHAPELCETVVNEVSTVSKSIDLWALGKYPMVYTHIVTQLFSGIIIYYCLKGRFPWQKATIMCKPFYEWEQWLKRKNPQLPRRWEPFTEKSLKIFKRTLNPKPKDRWMIKDLRKCIEKERLLKQSKVSSVIAANHHQVNHECT
jgi:serine/threonine-protein kinase SBK